MKRRHVLLTIGTVAAIVVGWFVYDFYVQWRALPYQYAAWDTANLIVEHLDTHDGQWPKSWDDLIAAADTLPRDGRRLYFVDGEINHFEDLPKLVAVDWNADPETIAQVEREDVSEAVRVVTRADGGDIRVMFADPNGIIWGYLRERSQSE